MGNKLDPEMRNAIIQAVGITIVVFVGITVMNTILDSMREDYIDSNCAQDINCLKEKMIMSCGECSYSFSYDDNFAYLTCNCPNNLIEKTYDRNRNTYVG